VSRSRSSERITFSNPCHLFFEFVFTPAVEHKDHVKVVVLRCRAFVATSPLGLRKRAKLPLFAFPVEAAKIHSATFQIFPGCDIVSGRNSHPGTGGEAGPE
jgi:hypothetical protein